MQNKISALLAYQLPAFVREDHELFVSFVQAYYEWMEEEGNALYFTERFEDNLDIDLADSEYVTQFVNELAVTFPKNTLIPTPQLIKVIKEFYIAKGSEQSFRFLFTILYDAEITIQHPQEFLHRSSDGKYLSNDYAYITGNNEFKISDILAGAPENIAASIEGVTSGAKAVIDTIVTTYILNQKVLKLDISSYQGKFSPNEEVILSVNNTTVKETIYGLINDIAITDGGTNYKLDDEVTITTVGDGQRAKAKIKRLDKGPFDLVTIVDGGLGYEVGDQVKATKIVDSAGYGFAAQVYSVDGSGTITAVQILNGGHDYSRETNAYVISGGSGAVLELNGDRIGKILNMEVFDSGINYNTVGDITIAISSANGINAVLTPVLTGVFNEPKSYQNQDDFPSNYSKIQDSYYYQNFSYVIQSKISPHEWLGTIKRVAHPAGMQLFGSLLIETEFDISLMLAPDFVRSLTIIISILTELDIPNSTAYEDDYITLIRINDTDACGIDLTLGDLENMKFLDTFNWTIGEFADNTINDVVTPCQQPMEFMENSEIAIL